jgi:hypothetical protein
MAMMLFSLVLLLWFALANLHLTGMGVMAVGLCANVVPVVVNQGMPVRAEALVHADVARSDDVRSIELSGGRHLERPSDHFVVLADIIPVPAAGTVVSFGDLIIFVATIDVIVHLVRRQRHTPAHAAGRHSPELRYGEPALDLRDRAPADITTASPVHDWGDAPRPVPSSGSQNSESPDVAAPSAVLSAIGAPATHNR